MNAKRKGEQKFVREDNFDVVKARRAAENLFECFNIKLPEETPERFSRMLFDLTRYQNVSNYEIAEDVNKTFDFDTHTNSKNMVLIKDIEAFSLCEHHVALMYDMKISVAYIPNGFVLGLSKIVRMVEMVCKRLQLQEKICEDIFQIMKILVKSENIAIHITAKHSCVTARGIKNVSSKTVTTKFGGTFNDDQSVKASFLESL